MKFSEIIKRKGFFAALSGVIILLLQAFGVSVEAPVVNEALTGISALLVIIGAISLADKKLIDDELKGKNDDDSDTEKK